ncbi:MAG: PAC2 family protein [Halovenus sp.]|uniref:proteasome assembly chaperone family protein n=1 Tax=Halovenus amylolytica TaxID=2500550 RepID=UPI000FE4010B
MAHIETHSELDLESPVLVEGLPGVGLVGKIATDHIINSFEMEHFASCHCEGLPRVATYEAGSHQIRPPIRIYGDERRDLLALQSDVPVSPETAPSFASCVTGWLDEHDVTPICLSGLPAEKDDVPKMYGIGTGDSDELLDEHDIDAPDQNGLISGPTGALLAEAGEHELGAVGLIVQSNKQFPDPEAARILLLEGIEPIAGISVETESLVEKAEEIADAKENLAKQMEQATQESSQAQPLGMYQ